MKVCCGGEVWGKGCSARNEDNMERKREREREDFKNKRKSIDICWVKVD